MSVLSAALSNDVASLTSLIAGGGDLEATDAVRGGGGAGWCEGRVHQWRTQADGRSPPHRNPDTPPPRLAPLRTQDGKTALMCAAKNNAEGVAKLLIEAKAKLEAKDEVRPVGRCICIPAWRLVGGRAVGPGCGVSMSAACMHACTHARAAVQWSLAPLARRSDPPSPPPRLPP